MLWNKLLLPAAGMLAVVATPAYATSFTVDLAGDTTAFSNSQVDFGGLHFNSFFLSLSGLDATNAITVAQGDTIHATVTFNNLLTIPASVVRTDMLLYFFGSAFPAQNTGVDGTFQLFDGTTLVNTFSYSSTTSGQLAGFAAIFPPNNGAMTFDSLVSDFTINTLATPATLDGSAFQYSLVSNAVPEPATWAMMIGGFGAAGVMMRRRQKVKVRFA